MSCTGIKQELIVTSDHTKRSLRLSAKEQRILLSIWFSIEDKEELGKEVFLCVFKQKPDLLQLWNFQSKEIDEIRESSILQKHAKGFSQFLDVVVRSLAMEGNRLVEVTRKIGTKHAYFQGVSFEAGNWLLFKNSVIENLLKQSTAYPYKKAYKLWTLLMTFVIGEMKEAFYKEIRKKGSSISAPISKEEESLFEELKIKYEQTIDDEESENDVFL